MGALARPEVYRASSLVHDLVGLQGPDWARTLPLLPQAERYAQAVAVAAQGSGDGLAGHAYVRYLGDLSGGQILSRLLAKRLGLSEATLSFYAFPRLPDIAAYKRSYIQGLDQLGTKLDRHRVVAAALSAFAINIEISEAVQSMAADPALEPL